MRESKMKIYSAHFEEVYKGVLEALNCIGAKNIEEDKESGIIRAKTRKCWWKNLLGENLEIRILPTELGVKVEAYSWIRLNPHYNLGVNRDNLRDFYKILDEKLKIKTG